MAGRESQDVSLPITQPTTAKARESQDIALPITQPTTAKARESQDVALPVTQPSTANARASQDLILYIMAFLGARDSQDIVLPVLQPSTALARVSQDVILYIQQNVPPEPPTKPCYGYYESLITSQYQQSTNYLSWLGAVLQLLCDAQACLNTFPSAFTIATAVGAQLDILGTLIGVSRVLPFQPTGGISPVLDDPTYRILLQAKIVQNQFNGQYMGANSTLWTAWQQLFPGGTIYVIDNQDMTADIILAGSFTSIIQQMILNHMIVPEAEAVQFNYTFATLPIFGADQNNSFVAGADIGHAA